MQRRICRVLLPAAAAISLTVAGCAGPAAATAGQPGITARYSTSSAGYATGGPWRFRFVAASLAVPACPADPAGNALASVVLTGGRYLAAISVACGGGASSAGYLDHHFGSGAFRISPRVGDVLHLSVYRDRAARRDYFTLTDAATGRSQTVAVATPRVVVYRHAELAVSLGAPGVASPTADQRLWSFAGSLVTSYDGTRAGLRGPWPARMLVATVTGTVAGAVVMSPSELWGRQQFGVWLRHRPAS
ncbi:MAG TPA: hypothetical protein VIX86_22200 [Streptosporangiaceae bacterium]